MAKNPNKKQNYSLIDYILFSLVPFSEPNCDLVFNTHKFFREIEKRKATSRNSIYSTLNRAKRLGYICEIEDKEQKQLSLTSKGRIKILKHLVNKQEWDKKWRVLIFDIPTKPKIYNQAREALRRKIKDLGFYQMQKSTWVYPYECEDEILFVAELFQVQKHIEILTVEKLLHEEKLKKEFGLK